MRMLGRLWEDEQGQDLIEYALIAAFAAAAAPAIWGSGYMSRLRGVLEKISDVLLQSAG